MALADFFAKDNPRGKAVLERFTSLLREMVGTGLGACELLATIWSDNPRTSAMFTPKHIQEILATLPDSRDRANSMRLLRSICRARGSPLPSMQRMVAVTVVVGADTVAVRGGVFNSGGAAAAVGEGAVGTGDGKHSRQEAGTAAAAAGGGGREGLAETGKESLLRNSRGLFRYELVRDSDATAISAKEAATAEGGHGGSGDDSHHQQRQR
ncbi:unnamed protein product, partial [Ectocarpus fasciculatus]